MRSSQASDSLRALRGKRVLVGPNDTASLSTRMANALAEQGVRTYVLNLTPHHYLAGETELGQARAITPRLIRWLRDLSEHGILGRALGRCLSIVLRTGIVLWAALRVDAVILIANRSILGTAADLRLFRLAGIRIVRLFVGSESRPRYLTGRHDALLDESTRGKYAKKLEAQVDRQCSKVLQMSELADVVIENPLCGHFQRKAFVNWFQIGFPHDERLFGGLSDSTPKSPLVVMHCPSNPEIKGTARIEAALEAIRSEGYPLDYRRITGMPRSAVLEALPDCDLLIDELYSDSPMAGIASEAAAFGKAILVGGYGWETLRAGLPPEALPPTIQIRSDDFEKELRKVITNPELRASSGQRAHEFINDQWGHAAVAERLAILLDPAAEIPKSWLCDPRQIRYWQGLGCPEEHRREVLEAFVEERGVGALCVPRDSAFAELAATWGKEPSTEAR